MATKSYAIHCDGCGYTGKLLVAHHGYKWWMLPLGFLIACTGVGLIPLAVVLIWLGNRTFDACPSCKGTQFAAWIGDPSAESEAVWQEAYLADERAFKKNKLILFAVVMAILAAALVFMYYQMPRRP